MDRVRQAVHAEEAVRRGLSGKGVTVAVLDTGLSPGPDFYGRIVKFVDLVNGRKACYDDSSHGTHVCGILGGSGKLSRGRYAGIAPGCLLVPVKVLDRDGGGAFADVRKGIWWVIENRKRYKIRILNLSVGTVREEKEEGDEAEEALILEAAEAAWDAGIVVVAASGNKGPADKSITVPGSSRKVITVGAYDDCGKICYSGRGPTRECICKPDLCAPGSGILSTAPLGAGRRLVYQRKSGTSMAAPVVSGAAALLLEKYPDLTNVEVKIRMKESAEDLGLPKNWQGWGRIHIGRLTR